MQTLQGHETASSTPSAPPRPGGRLIDVGLLGVALVWGSSYLAAKTAAASASIAMVVFSRYALSTACATLVVYFWRARGTTPVTAPELKAGVLLGTTQAAVLGLETWGVANTSAANAGVLISLTIILAPLLEGLLGEPMPGRILLAAAVSVTGVAALSGSDSMTGAHLGIILMLAAALTRAAHVILIGRLSSRAQRPLRPLHLTTIQLATGTLWSLVFAAPNISDTPRLVSDPGFLASVVYLALWCSVFAFLVQTWAIQSTSATRASLLLGTEPVWAVLVALLIGGEHLTPIAAVGCALVLLGCWWGQSLETTHRERPQH